MASNLLKTRTQAFKTIDSSSPFALGRPLFPSLPFPAHHQNRHSHVYSFPSNLPQNPRILPLSLHCSLSSSPTPPTSRDQAILQAKTCLATTLEKPLNNPKLIGKFKRLKQPRFCLEIPVIDDSPASLSQLASDIFLDLPIKRKGTPVKILILWPNPTLKNTAIQAFESHSASLVEHNDLSSVTSNDNRILSSAEVTVFLAPNASQLAVIKSVTDSLYPKPMVIFNPTWGFEEETDFGDMVGFVDSFEVIYSFMGLEVRGILSKRKGMIFRCVRDGIVSGEKWNVLVEEEGKFRVVSKFKARPSIGEVETVLYNLMAINSPVTKSVKFLRDLVSNVTGKK